MNHIAVLWYSGQSALSRLIQFVTRSTFSHTAIMVDGVLYEALGTGIKRIEGKPARRRARQAVAHSYLPATDEDTRQVQSWLDAQVGHGYSVTGFILSGIQSLTGQSLIVSIPGEYICSGLVARALQIAGYLPDTEARLESPASLALQLNPTDLLWTDPHLPSATQLEREAARKTVVVGEGGE